MSHDVNCPYCNEEIEICHDDGFGFDEDMKHMYDCPSCEKMFVFTTSISVYHEAFTAECLNTEEDTHIWKLTNTWPRKYSQWRCSDCETEKTATRDEIEAVYPDAFKEEATT